MHEELRALKRKVSIIAANVLGEAEGESMDVAKESEEIQPSPSNGDGNADDDDDNDDGGVMCTPEVEIADGTASTDGDKTTSVDHDGADGDRETMTDTAGGQQPQQCSNPRMLPRRVKARKNWGKVRTHRAFLVKKIRRQVQA